MGTKFTYTEVLSNLGKRSSLGIETLYRQYANQLRGYAMTQWKFDEDTVWDIVYQTLEALALKLPTYTFNSQAEFDHLVFKYFLNYLRQHYRKVQAGKKIEWVSIDNDIADDETDQDQPLTENSENSLVESISEFYKTDELTSPNLARLEVALDRLEPIDRELLLLRAREYSYTQIAEMLEIENNHLNVKYLRAKKKLIKLFNEIS